MNKKVLLILTVMLPIFLISQEFGKISGKVTAKDSGTPLVGANISIEETSLGSATDAEGNFLIIGVPVGSYSIRCDYIGYQSVKMNQVVVIAGITTDSDFELVVSAIQGDLIEIVGEKPLIVPSSTNAVRDVYSEEIRNFATRNVDDMVSVQAGIVSSNGLLHIRGSRSDEVGYELEGANTRGVQQRTGNFQVITGGDENFSDDAVANLVTTIPEALETISIQSGGFSADLGGANAGIVQASLKTGGKEFHGSVQIETDAIAESIGDSYSYGANDIIGTIGGPITEKIRFFGAVQKSNTDNWKPQFWEGAVINNGEPIPDLEAGITPTGDSVIVILSDEIDGREQEQINFNGTLLFDYSPLQIRIGGTMSNVVRRINTLPFYAMFNMERLPERNIDNYLFNAKATYFINKDTYASLNINSLSSFTETYDPNFDHETVSDILEWGDSLLVAEKGLGTYKSRYTRPTSYNVGGFVIARPGRNVTGYSKILQAYLGTSGDYVTQLGAHEIKTGFDWKNWTVRSYSFSTGAISSINQEIDMSEELAASFESEGDLAALKLRASRVNNIGYDEFGNELDDGVDGAKHPFNFSFYVNDKYETDDIVVNVGIRIDSYNLDDFVIDDVYNPPYDQYESSAHEEELHDSDTHSIIQPRLGLAFPLTDISVFHLQYGKFAQLPDLAMSYKSRSDMALYMGGQNFITDPIGFDLEPIETTQYEVGYTQQIGNYASFDITAFTKNTEGQLIIEQIDVPADNEYGADEYPIYTNGDFTKVNGVEFTVKTRRVNHFMINMNYTYSDARGTNSYPNSNSGNAYLDADPPTLITPLRYEFKHKGSINLDYRYEENEGGVLANSGINLLATFNSGHPFTLATGGMGQRAADEGAILGDNDPRNRLPVEPMGASTTPWIFNIDLKADKSFQMGGIDLNVYLTISNLFDVKHVINVYNRTGNAYDDGFLTDPELSEVILEGQGANYMELYNAVNIANRQHWIEDHGYDLLGTPREAKIGLSVLF